jgi:hypothetical protein
MDVIHQPQKWTKKRPASAGQSLFPHDKYRMLPIAVLIVETTKLRARTQQKKGGRCYRPSSRINVVNVKRLRPKEKGAAEAAPRRLK